MISSSLILRSYFKNYFRDWSPGLIAESGESPQFFSRECGRRLLYLSNGDCQDSFFLVWCGDHGRNCDYLDHLAGHVWPIIDRDFDGFVRDDRFNTTLGEKKHWLMWVMLDKRIKRVKCWKLPVHISRLQFLGINCGTIFAVRLVTFLFEGGSWRKANCRLLIKIRIGRSRIEINLILKKIPVY